jgi:hypothetical protein
MDLSNSNNGSYRSDQGLAAFTQSGQNGQQQRNGSSADGSTSPRGWASNVDPEASNDSSRAASSRIDYRV